MDCFAPADDMTSMRCTRCQKTMAQITCPQCAKPTPKGLHTCARGMQWPTQTTTLPVPSQVAGNYTNEYLQGRILPVTLPEVSDPIRDEAIELCTANPSCGLPDEECGCRAKNCPGQVCWRCGRTG